jgi:hypothetical protein
MRLPDTSSGRRSLEGRGQRTGADRSSARLSVLVDANAKGSGPARPAAAGATEGPLSGVWDFIAGMRLQS